MKLTKKRGILYLIADCRSGLAPIEEALAAGVDYLQLREKNLSSAEYLRNAKAVKALCLNTGRRSSSMTGSISPFCAAPTAFTWARQTSLYPTPEGSWGKAGSSAPPQRLPNRPKERSRKAPTTWAAAPFSQPPQNRTRPRSRSRSIWKSSVLFPFRIWPSAALRRKTVPCPCLWAPTALPFPPGS